MNSQNFSQESLEPRRLPRPTGSNQKFSPQRRDRQSLIEWDDAFLQLFPHRFDYLYATHPDPQARPQWQTERRHPLSDRLIRQGSYLYGVRFAPTTQYVMLDLDQGSVYHPHQDPLAVSRMLAALEPLGLVAYVACTSSYSGGMHLYLPFESPQRSWEIALVVQTLLQNAGFKLNPGQLELFPNPRPYSANLSLYNGHRLPMQAGSYLLNGDWQVVVGYQSTFVQQWELCQRRNDVDAKVLKQVRKQALRDRYAVSVKAEKYLNDLTAEIEVGWTGRGQTNRLLSQIARREYIFGHLLRGGEPLVGEGLTGAIVEVARSLPGFTEFCNHQADIEQRAAAWARSTELSPDYYPYTPGGKRQVKANPVELTWNQRQSAEARARIAQAVAELQSQNALPDGITARRAVIIERLKMSHQTLSKHRDLWHPEDLKAVATVPPLQAEIVSDTEQNPLKPRPRRQLHALHYNKFYPRPFSFSALCCLPVDVFGFIMIDQFLLLLFFWFYWLLIFELIRDSISLNDLLDLIGN
jgi:hypothetical protein